MNRISGKNHRFVAIAIIWLMISAGMAAQSLVMSGKVRDINTHREIPGVNIFIPELGIGTVSDLAGRFELEITRPEPDMRVFFQHVGFDTLSLEVEDVLSQKTIELQERLIPVPVVVTESYEDVLDIEHDLPQSVSVLDARVLDLHGYVDAGDLLQSEQSIQVDEELSGKKTVSIRGGNPDEVIVLFNGIRMNNALDNIFDVSLIDLTDVERLEVIKGSNTALYGSEAFSGVVNVVPRARQDYKIRFQQRIGSYNSGDWGLYLNNKIGKLYGGYSIKRGNAQRAFANEAEGNQLLENRSEHHTANLAYHFKETPGGRPISSLSLMYVRSELDFANERDSENLQNFNQMISARFDGDIGNLTGLSLSGAYQWLDESQFLLFADAENISGFLTRDIENRSWHFNADRTMRYRNLRLLVGYQYKQTLLDFRDNRFVISNEGNELALASLKRSQHGFVSIAKYRVPTRSTFFPSINFDASFRYDIVKDREAESHIQNDSPADDALWREQTIKISAHTNGSNGKFALNGFINLGSNVKFPTLMQQISSREILASGDNTVLLRPEKNHSIEFGAEISREVRRPQLFGWQLGVNLFHNEYQNKFRSYSLPGTPIAFFDNVPFASITGVEAQQRLFLFNKKVTMELGASRYSLSDLATFPFKYDRKYTFDIRIDEGGYSFRVNAFKEGEQIAQIRKTDGTFSEVNIGSVGNIDVFFSKAFEINRIKWFFNASFRNVLNDDYQLEGLTLRDRRYYFTLGVQY